MKFWLENLIYFIVAYLIVQFFYKFIINKKNIKKNKQPIEVKYLITKFNLDLRKINIEKLYKTTSTLNSIIVSMAFVIVMRIENLYLSLFLGVVIMLVLLYSLYGIVGGHYERKYGKK